MEPRTLRQGRQPVTSRTSRKRRAGGVSLQRNSKRRDATSAPDAEAEIARLTRELDEARSRLRDIEEKGTDAYTARKIETLIEAAQIARGHAFDASLLRSRAEGDLRALERAILEASGPFGWLLRRAARRVLEQAAKSPG